MESKHRTSKMQNLSNLHSASGTTPPFSASPLSLYPSRDPRAAELASISQSLELGRLLYQMRRRNSRVPEGEEPRTPTPFLHTAQPAGRVPFPLPAPPAFSGVPPFSVPSTVRTRFPLPAHPGYPPSAQSSRLLTPTAPQRGPSCTTTHHSQLTGSAVSETQRMHSCGTTPTRSSGAPPSPPCYPNFLAGNAASARSYDSDVVLHSRSDQAVKKKQRRKGKKQRSQNGDHQPLHQNRRQGKSKWRGKGSKRNPGGDSKREKPGERT